MSQTLRLFRVEILWFAALVLAGVALASYPTEARRFNCLYDPVFDMCHGDPVTCVCVI